MNIKLVNSNHKKSNIHLEEVRTNDSPEDMTDYISSSLSTFEIKTAEDRVTTNETAAFIQVAGLFNRCLDGNLSAAIWDSTF